MRSRRSLSALCFTLAASAALLALPPATLLALPGTTVRPQADSQSQPQSQPAPDAPARPRKKPARKSSAHHSAASKAHVRQSFVASTDLRPMAQQLATFRSPEAYAGVSHYAESHTGEAAAAAWLALGHAYLQDKRSDEAVHALQRADQLTQDLNDYAQYLEALALEQGNHPQQALALLQGYAARFPDSVFSSQLPITLARVQIQNQQPTVALATLRSASSLAGHSDYQYLKARALQLTAQNLAAAELYRNIYQTFPTSPDSRLAQQQLASLASTGVTLSAQQVHLHGDAQYAAKHYEQALEDYRAAESAPGITPSLHNDLRLDIAACSYKLKTLSRSMLLDLPDTQDDHGAERLYLLMEDARTRDDEPSQRSLVAELERRFPQSPWLEESLLSSGNMYFLSQNYPTAIDFYSKLLHLFPHSTNAAYCHWKTGWLNYRMGNYSAAGPLFDEHIVRYPSSSELPDALYWRGRLLEDVEHNPVRAKAYYQALSNAFHNYYFGSLATERLHALSSTTAEQVALLANVHPVHPRTLSDHVPEDDIHVIRARLLGNAGLNEYIAPEIKLSPDSADWAEWAELQTYAQAGETHRALQVAKRITPSYYAVPISSIPQSYWKVLFPTPYLDEVRSNSFRNSLDPWLVLSLIRQESEFNPSVISYANAYGLMQILPSTGKMLAHQQKLPHFSTNDLLNPPVNIQLGTAYLKQLIDEFHGQVEYALASYNAGDFRIQDWLKQGNYKDIPEFVESIPFTQTRDYVQAILRNQKMYERLNGAAAD